MKMTILSIGKRSVWFTENKKDPLYLPGMTVNVKDYYYSNARDGWYSAWFNCEPNDGWPGGECFCSAIQFF